MSTDFEASCGECGRKVKLEIEMSEDLINVVGKPCWGCVRTIVQNCMTKVKEAFDKEYKEEPCQK